MARGSGSARRGSRPPATRSPKANSSPGKKRPPASARDRPPEDEVVAAGPFTLGAIPGATPGKWIDTWNERMPRHPLTLVPLAVADQRRAIIEGEVDAALVRLPIERDGLSVIALYDEVPVVVSSADSHLTAVDELTLDDLAGEIVVVPADDVLGVVVAASLPPRFAAPETTADAIATVAAGVGCVIVPLSLARLHQRKDAAFRPLRDGPASTVALAWVSDRTTPLVEDFVGIVRGRTANSSRG